MQANQHDLLRIFQSVDSFVQDLYQRITKITAPTSCAAGSLVLYFVLDVKILLPCGSLDFYLRYYWMASKNLILGFRSQHTEIRDQSTLNVHTSCQGAIWANNVCLTQSELVSCCGIVNVSCLHIQCKDLRPQSQTALVRQSTETP